MSGRAGDASVRRPALHKAAATSELIVEGPFHGEDLDRVRAKISDYARDCELHSEHGEALALISTELLTNVILHSEGEGRLRIWSDGAHLYCQVADTGPGVRRPYKAGWQRPSPESSEGGRGLWVARMFSHSLTIDSSALGTTVTVRLSI